VLALYVRVVQLSETGFTGFLDEQDGFVFCFDFSKWGMFVGLCILWGDFLML